jgi:hypothetical protein
MSSNKLNNLNYITYSTMLKQNTTTMKNKNVNNNTLLAKEEDRFFRKEDLLNIINKSITYSNKIMRMLRQHSRNGFSIENINDEELLYKKLIPIGITEQIENPLTKKKYDIYGYPRRFAGDSIFGCRGKRIIKGTQNVLYNDMNQCISVNDIHRISLKAEYNSDLNKYFIVILLDDDRPISLITMHTTFLNSLTKKEKEFVKHISSQLILSIMYKENKSYIGSEFKNTINMGTNTHPLLMPNKEHISKLKMNEYVKVKEIPSWRNISGGNKNKRMTRRRKNIK